MGDDKENQKGVGFSGISSLLPDEPPDAAAQRPTAETGSCGSRPGAKQPSTSATASPSPSAPPPAPKSKQPAPRWRSGGGATWIWIGIAAVIFAAWAASQSGSEPDQARYQSPAAQTYSSTQPSAPGQGDQKTTATATTPSPDKANPFADRADPFADLRRDQVNNAVATTSRPRKLAVKKPPIGSGNVFSVAEIRYCLALKQRVEGAQPVIDTYNHGQVDRFNGMVDDYNDRCHDFRYYTGDLEQAQRDVAPYTQQFQAEGRRIVRRGDTHSTTAKQPTEPAVTRAMVGQAQRALNALGYNAGVPDGVMGPKTRAALKAFQKKVGSPPTGRIDAQSLAALSATLRRSTRTSGAGESSPARQDVGTAVDRQPSGVSPTRVDRFGRSPGASRNLQTCMNGNYAVLCKHALLTPEQAAKVHAAELRANLRTCMNGNYAVLCKHALLTPEQAAEVHAAELRANLRTCMNGNYAVLCKHALLTPEQAAEVHAAELRANLLTCMNGSYAALCKHSLLTQEQIIAVHDAERRAAARN